MRLAGLVRTATRSTDPAIRPPATMEEFAPKLGDTNTTALVPTVSHVI